MKPHFMLPFILLATYTVKANTSAETVSGVVKDDALLLAIEHKQTERKLNLLTEFVAFEWEFHDSADSANEYLSKVADFVLKDYNLTVKQKVNYIKASQILHLLKRTTAYEEHIARAYLLDKVVTFSTKENISWGLRMKYMQEEDSVKGLALHEGQLALDLLVQSFAPANIYTMNDNFRTASKEYNNLELELIIQSMRRAIGTLKLTNILLDPPFRLNISVPKALNIQRIQLLRLLEEKIKANFEVIYKLPEYQDAFPKTSINSQHHILPMITVYPLAVAAAESEWNGERQSEASTELNAHVETNSVTTSELYLYAQSKSKSIKESDKYAQSVADKSTKSRAHVGNISETTESRVQTETDAVTVAATESEWNGEKQSEATTELNAHAETNSATTSELHSYAQSKSTPIKESDKYAENVAEKSTKSGAHVGNISETTESRVQTETDAVAHTAHGADSKSSSETTTESDLYVEFDPVGVIETVGYTRNESSTESGARTDGDSVATSKLHLAAKGKPKTTRKSDAHSESNNETTTKSSDSVVQALSHTIAPTETYADAKNKSQTTTERDALAESNSISTPIYHSRTKIVPRRIKKSGNLAAVTQPGGYINIELGTTTESGAQAGSDSVPATISDTKAAISKSGANTEGNSVATTNSGSSPHSELEETTESDSRVENDLVTTKNSDSLAKRVLTATTESNAPVVGGLRAALTSDTYSDVLSTFIESDRVVLTETDSEVTTEPRDRTES